MLAFAVWGDLRGRQQNFMPLVFPNRSVGLRWIRFSAAFRAHRPAIDPRMPLRTVQRWLTRYQQFGFHRLAVGARPPSWALAIGIISVMTTRLNFSGSSKGGLWAECSNHTSRLKGARMVAK